jgi:hypothetical protein
MIKKKKEKIIFSCVFFLTFLAIKTLVPDSLEILDPDPYPVPKSMNPNPKHWIEIVKTYPRE